LHAAFHNFNLLPGLLTLDEIRVACTSRSFSLFFSICISLNIS
jgi:hypothetical protein